MGGNWGEGRAEKVEEGFLADSAIWVGEMSGGGAPLTIWSSLEGVLESEAGVVVDMVRGVCLLRSRSGLVVCVIEVWCASLVCYRATS